MGLHLGGSTIAQLDSAYVQPLGKTTTGTAAAARWINVKDYGAKGDTVLDGSGNYVSGTNDAAAILAALNAAKTLKAKVYFPAGNYRVASSVAYTGSVDIVGDGATIYCSTAIPFDFSGNVLTDNVTFSVKGITTGGATATALRANYFHWNLAGFSKVTFEDCEFRNCDEFAIYASNCNHISVARNRFLSCNKSTGDADTLGRYMTLATCNYISVVDNYFTSTITYVDGSAFGSVSFIGTDLTHLTIARNHVYEAGGFEVYTNGDGITVDDNRIENVHRYGIKLDESSNLRVTNNKLVNSHTTAFRFLIGVTPYSRMDTYGSTTLRRGNVVIEGNTIDNCPQPYLITVAGRAYTEINTRQPAATSQADANVYGVRIARNTIKNSASITPVLLNYVNDAAVIENYLDSNTLTTQSAGMVDVLGLGEKADVVGNRIYFTNNAGVTSIGVRFAAAAGYTGSNTVAIVERNYILNTSGTPTSTYGIDMSSVTRQKIIRNHVNNVNTYLFLRSGTDLLVADNNGTGFSNLYANCVLTVASYTTVNADLVRAPSLAAGGFAGTSPPAPVLTSGSRDWRGSLTFGTGTTPAAGTQVSGTWGLAYKAAPNMVISPQNAATQALGLYVTTTTTGFAILATNAPTASQANTVYSISYVVSQQV